MSLESRLGWHDLRLAMEAWPERILEARSNGNGERDELDFYLCFFVQCWSLVDWAKECKVIPKNELQEALRNPAMAKCHDIAIRYKHLTINNKAYTDKDWKIWLDHEDHRPIFVINISGQHNPLWELMTSCISFWEQLAAAYDLDSRTRIFRPS